MKDPRMDEFRAWQKAANGLLNKIALAPEREGGRRLLYVQLRAKV